MIILFLVRAEKFNSCEKYAREFLQWLIHQQYDNMQISVNAYTFALLTMLKKNELARDYCEGGQTFKMISNLLDHECAQEP